MFKHRVNIYKLKTDSVWNVLKNKTLIVIIVMKKLFPPLSNMFFPYSHEYLHEKTAQ